jgi:urate oxidase
MPHLTSDTYGKTGVRLTQILRSGDARDVVEIDVRILFEGDFAASYVTGDNRAVLPTDTIKNTVYVIARQKPIKSIEEFARDLASHFLARLPHLNKVAIDIHQKCWNRIDGSESSFVQAGAERRMTMVSASRSDELFTSGIRDLEILKTSKSAFADYMRDEYTTLPETHDRLFGTVLNADWTYRGYGIDFNACHKRIRERLLSTFSEHESRSVQHTLYAMGECVLDAFQVVDEIHLVMPNKHRLLVDLSRFNLDNPNQIFVPTDEPSGYIEARISR